MNLDESIRSHLASVSAITTLVSARIYPDIATQDKTMPRIVYRLALPEEEMGDLSNTRSPLAKATYEVASMDGTFDGSRALAALVQAALIGFRGVMGGAGGAFISSICAEGRRSDYAAESGIHIMSCEFEIFYYI